MKKILGLFLLVAGLCFYNASPVAAADAAPHLIQLDVSSVIGSAGQPDPLQKDLAFFFDGPVSSPLLSLTSGITGQTTQLTVNTARQNSIQASTGILLENDVVRFDLTYFIPGTQTPKSYEGILTANGASQANFVSGYSIKIVPITPDFLTTTDTFTFTTKLPVLNSLVSVIHQPQDSLHSYNTSNTAPQMTFSMPALPYDNSGAYLLVAQAIDSTTSQKLFRYYAGITPGGITPTQSRLTVSIDEAATSTTMTINNVAPMRDRLFMDMFSGSVQNFYSNSVSLSSDRMTMEFDIPPLKTFGYAVFTFADNGYINNKKGSFESTTASAQTQAESDCLAGIEATIRNDLAEFGISVANFQSMADSKNFICIGNSPETISLGQGERRAVLRDYFNALGFNNVFWDDIQRISTGTKPIHRNLTKEQANVPTALAYFKKIFGHSPVFTNSVEDLAWNTLMYRIRFPRNLTLEAAGITKFRQIFGRTPVSPIDWASVRILGYVKR